MGYRRDCLLLGIGKPRGIAGVGTVEAVLWIFSVGRGSNVLLLILAQLYAVTLAKRRFERGSSRFARNDRCKASRPGQRTVTVRDWDLALPAASAMVRV